MSCLPRGEQRGCLDPVLRPVSFNGWQVLLQGFVFSQKLQHLGQRYDADHRDAEVALDFLDGRQFAIAALLAVEGDQYARRFGALGVNDLHDFTDGGAGRDHVVNDQNVAFKRRTDQAAAFAVGLGFFAVETPWHVAIMVLGQSDGGGRGQRDTFVSRAKQHVESNAAVNDGGGIEAPQLSQRGASVEQAGIEEVGAGAPGLQGELTEAQNAAINGKTDKVALIRLHENGPRYHGFS